MITMYGITNCQTVQKARQYLDSRGISYAFHDYKKSGIDSKRLEAWCALFGWEKVLNRAGMMWRKADEAEKARVVDTKTAIEFMLKTPTAIKRPVLETESITLIGFDQKEYEAALL